MRRLLVITILEYKARPNNRLHHTVDSLKKEFDEVYLLYRTEPSRRGGMDKITNLIPWVSPVRFASGVHEIEYNPPLNWVEKYDFAHGPERKSDVTRKVVRQFSNLFGLVREFCFITFIFFVCLLRLRGKDFTVCLVETSWEGICALIMRSMRRVKYIVFDDNDFGPGYMQNILRRKWEVFLDKTCVRSSNLVLCAGSLLADLWRKETGRDVLVVPNGVDLRNFRGSVRRLNKQSPRAVYVGNLSSSWMDFQGAFEAMAILKGKYPGISFDIIGDEGEERFAELKRAADEAGISDAVRFLGKLRHDRVPDALSKCDIGFALTPSNQLREYAFPLKVVEYMAMGIPVIASKGVETERVVSRYRCGLCVGFEIDDLRRAIETLIEDEDQYREFSENGLKGAADFDLDRLSKLRIDAINDLMV